MGLGHPEPGEKVRRGVSKGRADWGGGGVEWGKRQVPIEVPGEDTQERPETPLPAAPRVRWWRERAGQRTPVL